MSTRDLTAGGDERRRRRLRKEGGGRAGNADAVQGVLARGLLPPAVLILRCPHDQRAAVVAAKRAQGMAWQAAAVRNRHAARHASEDAARGGTDVWRWAVPLQHDQRLVVAAN